MDAVLDEIAFLANSKNRVTVLETLVEAPHSRDGIRDRTDASRVTIARILREFEERDWITHSGQEYTVTPLGEWVCEEFVALIEEMEAVQRLRESLQWFPSDLLTFDVRCLRDAELLLLDGSDATVFIRRVLEFHRSGDHIRGVATMAAPVFIENHWESTVHGEKRLEMVITPEVLDVVRNHPPSARQFREMLDEEAVRFSIHEDIPMSVGIVDGTVGINLTDEEGVVKGGIVSEDEAVYEWAVDLFRTCEEEARPVDVDEITA